MLHLEQTIDALKANTLAKESDLYIFSDAAKSGDEGKVDAVRKYIDTINGFKNVYVIKRTENSRVRNSRDGIAGLLEKVQGNVPVFLKEVMTRLEMDRGKIEKIMEGAKTPADMAQIQSLIEQAAQATENQKKGGSNKANPQAENAATPEEEQSNTTPKKAETA